MDWGTVAVLIAQIGLSATRAIIAKWEANGKPSVAEYDEIAAMARQRARDRMLLALAAANPPIDPNSPTGQAFLAAAS